MTSKLKISLVHLDLGIGGAERLVVNVACALQDAGYSVQIITSHHDEKHSFDETKSSGQLGGCVRVYGDWIPRNIRGKFTALCAILRMLYISGMVVVMHVLGKFRMADRANCCDVLFIDGVSAPIPLFYFLLPGVPVIFYCHFPDKLLCVDRRSTLKRAYRILIDFVEELTTGCSTTILVNSIFTAKVFEDTFPSLARRFTPRVLYPTIEEEKERGKVNDKTQIDDDEFILHRSLIAAEYRAAQWGRSGGDGEIDYTSGYDYVFVSLNRYERKKNIALALRALAHYSAAVTEQPPSESHGNMSKDSNNHDTQSLSISQRTLLVIAGGYDTRVQENVEYLKELRALAEELQLEVIEDEDEHKEGDGHERDVKDKDKVIVDAENDNNKRKISSHPVGDHRNSNSTCVSVIFRRSISGREREALLKRATAVLYTPDNEHFGIVPLEAMYSGAPVIAVNSGGPLETVVQGETGFLCPQTPEDFGEAMRRFTLAPAQEERDRLMLAMQGNNYRTCTGTHGTATVSVGVDKGIDEGVSVSESERPFATLTELMGRLGRARVRANFTSAALRINLEECIQSAINAQRNRKSIGMWMWALILAIVISLVAVCVADARSSIMHF